MVRIKQNHNVSRLHLLAVFVNSLPNYKKEFLCLAAYRTSVFFFFQAVGVIQRALCLLMLEKRDPGATLEVVSVTANLG